MSKPEVIIYSHYDESAAFIEGLINNLGCSVRRCTNAPEALSLCAKLKPSLLIVLNGCLLLNGSELIERLRPSSRHDPAIYVVSWQQSEQAILSLLEIGVDQYITFPICTNRLLTKVAELFNIKLH